MWLVVGGAAAWGRRSRAGHRRRADGEEQHLRCVGGHDGARVRRHPRDDSQLPLHRDGDARAAPPQPPFRPTQFSRAAQDTEFPGVVARPIGNFKSSSDFHYQTVRCNVDLLKIIQFGITLCNEEGELAPGICTYQFNFKFSLGCADPLAARSPKGPERFSPSCSV